MSQTLALVHSGSQPGADRMADPRTEQEVVERFQTLLQERDQLTSASIERQQEMAEHDLVIKTLEPLDGGRKCFRLVGDVLVERTVGEVLPAVKKNRDNLAAVSERKGRVLCCCQLPLRVSLRGRQTAHAVPRCAARWRPLVRLCLGPFFHAGGGDV